MKEKFGILPTGEETSLYTISCGGLTAKISDYGATLVNLFVPDKDGVVADVVLGYDDCNGYRASNGAFLGATVGRNNFQYRCKITDSAGNVVYSYAVVLNVK